MRDSSPALVATSSSSNLTSIGQGEDSGKGPKKTNPFVIRVKQPGELLQNPTSEENVVAASSPSPSQLSPLAKCADSSNDPQTFRSLEAAKSEAVLPTPRVNSLLTWTPPFNSSTSGRRVPLEYTSLTNNATTPTAQSPSVSCFIWVHLQVILLTCLVALKVKGAQQKSKQMG